MTVINTVWAWQQTLPALPKFLFVTLTDCAGMAEIYDVSFEKYRFKCGMSDAEIESSLEMLSDKGLIRLIELLEDEPGWRIRFTYDGTYSLPPGRWTAVAKRDGNSALPGWIYIIGTTHDVTKVGITTDLPARVKVITTNAGLDAQLDWSFACSMKTARELEQALLKHFAAHNFKGEWVRKASAEVIAVAIEMTRQPVDGPP